MKPVHDKVALDEFTPGTTYRVGMNGTPMYDATVTKFHGGCWATVRVERAVGSELASLYHPGMEFDIKVANYEISLPDQDTDD